MSKSIYTEQLDRLCELLVEARSSSGLTQRQLAEKLNRPHSYVAKVEIGERRLDVVEFIEFCAMLDISPEQVISEMNKVPKRG